jgi:hypothetical protein
LIDFEHVEGWICSSIRSGMKCRDALNMVGKGLVLADIQSDKALLRSEILIKAKYARSRPFDRTCCDCQSSTCTCYQKNSF